MPNKTTIFTASTLAFLISQGVSAAPITLWDDGLGPNPADPQGTVEAFHSSDFDPPDLLASRRSMTLWSSLFFGGTLGNRADFIPGNTNNGLTVFTYTGGTNLYVDGLTLEGLAYDTLDDGTNSLDDLWVSALLYDYDGTTATEIPASNGVQLRSLTSSPADWDTSTAFLGVIFKNAFLPFGQTIELSTNDIVYLQFFESHTGDSFELDNGYERLTMILNDADPPNPPGVPSPATIVLLGAGLLGMGIGRRRNKG